MDAITSFADQNSTILEHHRETLNILHPTFFEVFLRIVSFGIAEF